MKWDLAGRNAEGSAQSLFDAEAVGARPSGPF
jgi:hypothetical protein